MDWCRLSTSYYLDAALLRAGEAAEVLFLRCLAYSGSQETGGRVPLGALQLLTPTRTQQRLSALLREQLLVEDGADVLIRSWDRHQEALDAEAHRRKGDRERKARQRELERLNGYEVYRLYSDADLLLYVGQTNNLSERLRQHSYESPWWQYVAWACLESAVDITEALAIERQAIAEELPVHNRSRGNVRPAGWAGHDSAVTRVRDSERDASGTRPRKEVEVEVEEKRTSAIADAPPIRSDVEGLCRYFLAALAGDDVKGTITAKWRTEARLLLDKDKRPPAEIRAVIDWATRDQFWRANVLSVPKLREKYDQLRLQMTAGRPVLPEGDNREYLREWS